MRLCTYSRTWWMENIGRSIEITDQRNKGVQGKNVAKFVELRIRPHTRIIHTVAKFISNSFCRGVMWDGWRCPSSEMHAGIYSGMTLWKVELYEETWARAGNFQIIPFVFPNEAWRCDVSIWNDTRNSFRLPDIQTGGFERLRFRDNESFIYDSI